MQFNIHWLLKKFHIYFLYYAGLFGLGQDGQSHSTTYLLHVIWLKKNKKMFWAFISIIINLYKNLYDHVCEIDKKATNLPVFTACLNKRTETAPNGNPAIIMMEYDYMYLAQFFPVM